MKTTDKERTEAEMRAEKRRSDRVAREWVDIAFARRMREGDVLRIPDLTDPTVRTRAKEDMS